MILTIVLWSCLAFFVLINASIDKPLLVIPDGALLGSVNYTLAGKPYLSFEGIPYAAAPVGNLRFAEPQPVVPWQGIRNATYVRGMCSQLNGLLLGSEDCLYANVYVPRTFVHYQRTRKKQFNVIVYIHSGSFSVFTGNTAGPQYIFDYDESVILVTFNYRLGILGFFSLGDDIAPGNNGLKDQVALLRWVRRNILYFGGDPDRVTIAGTSAGGASVHLHMMSSLSKGLFWNAISDAGAALTPWVIATNVTAKSLEVTKELGCPLISSTDMLQCLRRIPFGNITSLMQRYESFVFTPIAPFGAVVEPCLSGAFLTAHPQELLTSKMVNDVPWLIGTNQKDGLFPASVILADPGIMTNLTVNWRKLFEPLLNLEYNVPKHLLADTINRIKTFYFGSKDISFNTADILVQLLNDRQFKNGVITSAQYQASRCKSPVYMYQFNYRGKYSTTNELTGNMMNYGVGHIDDSLYVIYDSQFQPLENKTKTDQDMTELMTRLWTSFAKSGQPNLAENRWLPLPCNGDLLIILNINNRYNVNVKYVKEGQIRRFWKMLPSIPLSGYTGMCPITPPLIVDGAPN